MSVALGFSAVTASTPTAADVLTVKCDTAEDKSTDKLWAEAGSVPGEQGGCAGWLDFGLAVNYFTTSLVEQELLNTIMALSAVSAPGKGMTRSEFDVAMKLIMLVQCVRSWVTVLLLAPQMVQPETTITHDCSFFLLPFRCAV